MLGIESIDITNGVIRTWVNASAGRVAYAIAHPAVSLSGWNRVAFTIAIAAARLVTIQRPWVLKARYATALAGIAMVSVAMAVEYPMVGTEI